MGDCSALWDDEASIYRRQTTILITSYRRCKTRFNRSLTQRIAMVTYYRVEEYPGDIYHKSEACAGDKATEIDENEAQESASRPCKNCFTDVSK